VLGDQAAECGDRAVHRVLRVVVRPLADHAAADLLVVGVGVDLRREHVLASVLVAARTREALLVAVVDDGLSAGEIHQ
jgi:acetoin utilization deacetylase AcuC-like enzyme